MVRVQIKEKIIKIKMIILSTGIETKHVNITSDCCHTITGTEIKHVNRNFVLLPQYYRD